MNYDLHATSDDFPNKNLTGDYQSVIQLHNTIFKKVLLK